MALIGLPIALLGLLFGFKAHFLAWAGVNIFQATDFVYLHLGAMLVALLAQVSMTGSIFTKADMSDWDTATGPFRPLARLLMAYAVIVFFLSWFGGMTGTTTGVSFDVGFSCVWLAVYGQSLMVFAARLFGRRAGG